MCGIFGFVGKRDRAESIDLSVALKSLHHRGPDDRGTYFGVSKKNPDIACAFAHTRLSIIDLSPAGHQPMTTEDGRYTIVYNGEIYNFRDIRSELEKAGCRFRSNSDTEVILNAYATWGPDSVTRLRGMFAYAVWDCETGSLFYARDRLGVKPLYIADTVGGFAFSSEVRTLLHSGIASRTLSMSGLTSYFMFGSVYEPHTIIDGIRAVPPAERGLRSNGFSRLDRYWASPFAVARREAPVPDISATVRKAVHTELESDVPLGIFLSGGIDSAALTAIASQAGSSPIKTFTVTFDEHGYDESRYANEIARRYGCDHHQVNVSAAFALTHADHALSALDQPSADGLNTYIVSRAAREAGLTVALSGLGGDEVFAGYSNFRRFGSLRSVGKLFKPASALLDHLPPRIFNALPDQWRKMIGVMKSGGDGAAVYCTLRSLFTSEEARRFAPRLDPTESPIAPANDADAVNLFSFLELTNYLRNTLLRDTDTMSMANSLEVRVPLLDHHVIEAIAAVPGKMKMSGTINKPLLVAAAGELPSAATSRPKMGFTLPMEIWLRGPLRKYMEEILFERTSATPFLDEYAVRRVWRRFLLGRRFTNYSRVWCLAALIRWCTANGVSEVSDRVE